MSSKRPIEQDPSESTFKKLQRIAGIPSGSSHSHPSAQQNATGSAHAAWARCTDTLQMLEKCSGVVPSLQPVVKTIIECIEELSDTNKRRQEFCDLASDLADLIGILIQHLEQTSSEMISNCLKNIVNGLEADLTRIKSQQQQSRLSRIGRAEQNEDDLIMYYRRIETHFKRLQANASLGMWSSMHEHIATSRLNQLSPAKQARYNSAQSSKPRRRTCNPNTRVAVLADMYSWSNSPNSPKLYWMNGMAGTGKTTIAYSLCDALQKTCQLGASFFCSRLLPECRDVNRIMPTIAYQLARFSLPFQSALCATLASDPDMGQCDLREQFDNLVMGPLLAAKDSIPGNVVVVIDALDECAESSETRTILDLFFHHAAKLPIKIFVTSRPEPTISDKMRALDDRSRSIFVLHDIEKTIVQSDIETYLSSELSSISPLPTEDQVRQLANQAGSLFIYAATALRYIRPENPIIDSHSRLLKMLQLVPGIHDRMHNEIDVLYTAILEAVSFNSDLEPEDVENVWIVLRTVMCLMEPMNIKAMAGFLGLKDEQKLSRMIKPLESVLHISSNTGLVSTLHASFPDFLLSRQRSGKHFCDRTEHNHLLVQHCFKTMGRSLRFNICNLGSSFVRDSDVADLKTRIGEAITPELFYTCRYWADHLLGSLQTQGLSSLLDEFLRSHLLSWMETMNLKGCISACVLILSRVHSWLAKHTATTELCGTCLEAQRFVTAFAASPISQSTPHIYVSLLSFWDRESIIWEFYGKRRRGMVKVEGPAIGRRSATLAIWKTESAIESLAFSPNGTHVVSGGSDGNIQIWDAQTGRIVAGAFEGHTDVISSVAFSPDGARVVSGSWDKTIRIWDAQSGRAVAGPFEGHTYRVSSVAFSPDGARVVSGSYDRTIRIWDAQSGRAVAGPFEGHTDGINSVTFSPDGARVVSGSDDRTIRIWDAQSGRAVAGPFEGHTDGINSVAFSPDGARVVSGSDDRTIRIWDAQSGSSVPGPFEGHTYWIRSVAFSPDGARVVSGSWDKTIRIWDAQSGRAVAGPFEGHTDGITSVAFSPDGARVVSGSYDRAIRIWDAQSRRTVAGPFEGHTSAIKSVAFSPDSARVASGSDDMTIRIWDAQSGRAVAGPFEGHTYWISSVAFSPEGGRVVSGSYDRTIRIWDAQSGRAVAGPFEGHTDVISSVAFSPDGAWVVSGSKDGTIQIRNAQSGHAIAGPFEGHTYGIISVAFSPDGARVVSGSEDRTIRIWDAQSGRAVAGPFEGHTSGISSVAFSPDGVRVVSGSYDKTIRIWDAQSGPAVTVPFEGHTYRVSSVAFSPDGARVVSGSYDRTIRIWDAQSGSIVVGPLEGHTDGINSVAFSPDGARVVSGSDDMTIRIWDAQGVNVAADLFEEDSPPFGSELLPLDDTQVASDFDTRHAHPRETSSYDTGPYMEWNISSDGWLVDSNSLILLWLPRDLCKVLKTPHNRVLISQEGYCSVDFEGALIGPDWNACFPE